MPFGGVNSAGLDPRRGFLVTNRNGGMSFVTAVNVSELNHMMLYDGRILKHFLFRQGMRCGLARQIQLK